VPKPVQWFTKYLKNANLKHATGYLWWKAFCAATARTLRPQDATAADRAAWVAWVENRRGTRAAARARKAAKMATRDAAIAACDHPPSAQPTLAELVTALVTRGDLKPSQAKDVKTSIGYLAEALGAESPEQCPVDEALAQEAQWVAKLETHFAAETAKGHPIQAGTRKNTKSNLRGLFRKAEAAGLLSAPLPSRLLARPTRAAFLEGFHKAGPYRATYSHPSQQRYGLPQGDWPPDIQAGWKAYQGKVFHVIRARTLNHTATILATYFGWLQHIEGDTPTWNALFEEERLRAFLQWHGQRVGKQISAHGSHVVQKAAAIAKVLGHPQAAALAAYRESLPAAESMHIKPNHTVSLRTLEEVADACLREGRVPILNDKDRTQSPGLRGASRFQIGLLLKTWVRVPVRQRNMREMQTPKHLAKRGGQWVLRFQGADLKVGKRGAVDNVYHINLSARYPELVPILEEWLTVFRPRVPGAAASPFVFLTQVGRPFTQSALRAEVMHVVAMRTGVRFFPHMIRTIWATEYLEAPATRGDFAGAATMLGDTIGEVIKTYYHVTVEEHQERGANFIHTQALGKG